MRILLFIDYCLIAVATYVFVRSLVTRRRIRRQRARFERDRVWVRDVVTGEQIYALQEEMEPPFNFRLETSFAARKRTCVRLVKQLVSKAYADYEVVCHGVVLYRSGRKFL